jgi:hypothetical protein
LAHPCSHSARVGLIGYTAAKALRGLQKTPDPFCVPGPEECPLARVVANYSLRFLLVTGLKMI